MPFKCVKCGAEVSPQALAAGGACKKCGRIFCRGHLSIKYMLRGEALCRECEGGGQAG